MSTNVINFLNRIGRDFTRPELAEEARRLAEELSNALPDVWCADIHRAPSCRRFLIKTKNGEVYSVMRTTRYDAEKTDPTDVMFRVAVLPDGMAVLISPLDVESWAEVPA